MQNTEQLAQVCQHMLELLDTRPTPGRCGVCDKRKIGRFIIFTDGEAACEDCVKNMANLAIEHAQCNCA